MCNIYYFLQQLWPLYSSVCALQERTVQFVRFLSHKPNNDRYWIIDNENQLLSLNKHIIFRQKMFFLIQVWALYISSIQCLPYHVTVARIPKFCTNIMRLLFHCEFNATIKVNPWLEIIKTNIMVKVLCIWTWLFNYLEDKNTS